MARERGSVKWFDTEKGWGFIRLEGGEEVFVHHSDIQSEGFRSLKDGAEVELEIERADRGPRARNVVPIGADGMPVSKAGKRSSERSSTGVMRSDSREGRSRRRERGRSGGNPDASKGATRSGGASTASRADRSGTGNGVPTLDEQVRTRLAPRFRFDD